MILHRALSDGSLIIDIQGESGEASRKTSVESRGARVEGRSDWHVAVLLCLRGQALIIDI
jgi:hypothetical protein